MQERECKTLLLMLMWFPGLQIAVCGLCLRPAGGCCCECLFFDCATFFPCQGLLHREIRWSKAELELAKMSYIILWTCKVLKLLIKKSQNKKLSSWEWLTASSAQRLLSGRSLAFKAGKLYELQVSPFLLHLTSFFLSVLCDDFLSLTSF